MRATFVQDLEKRINNNLSIRVNTFLEGHPYIGTAAVTSWLLGIFKTKLNGTTQFPDFDAATTGGMKNLLSEGDRFYRTLFRCGKFINKYTKENESKTPYTDPVRTVYLRLFTGNHVNDDRLTIYSELRALLERALGKQLASDPALPTYEH